MGSDHSYCSTRREGSLFIDEELRHSRLQTLQRWIEEDLLNPTNPPQAGIKWRDELVARLRGRKWPFRGRIPQCIVTHLAEYGLGSTTLRFSRRILIRANGEVCALLSEKGKDFETGPVLVPARCV